MKISVNDPCPCDSKQKYKKCCQSYHKGANAKEPLALMRSRYSAYVLGFAKYIMKTTHTSNVDYKEDIQTWEEDIKDFIQSPQFEGLTILDHYDNIVVFKAHMKQRGLDVSFIEKSEFIQENGKWYYLKGEFIRDK